MKSFCKNTLLISWKTYPIDGWFNFFINSVLALTETMECPAMHHFLRQNLWEDVREMIWNGKQEQPLSIAHQSNSLVLKVACFCITVFWTQKEQNWLKCVLQLNQYMVNALIRNHLQKNAFSVSMLEILHCMLAQ